MTKRDDLNTALDRLVASGSSYVAASQAKLSTVAAEATAAALATAADDPALGDMATKANGAADNLDAATTALAAPA